MPERTSRLHAPSANDPELELLLGTIRRRRLAQQVRERAAAVPGGPPLLPAKRAESRAAVRGAAGGEVLDIQAVGPSVRILRVARPAGFVFEAGQAVKLGLAGAPVRRTYSIASAPHETHLEFCIEQVPGGRFTSRLGEVSVGDRLELAPKPKAGIELLPGFTKHVMVATVTGIAPLRSLLRHALHGERPSGSAAPAFWVLHGASYADELPYAGELAELERSGRVAYLPTVSRPSETRNRGWSGRQGRVEAHVLSLLESLGPANGVAVYACGHPEMVRGVREMLTPLGYRVEVEAF